MCALYSGGSKHASKPLIKSDINRPAREQPVFHNRWHPDIPAAASIDQGKVFRVECIDWTGGQIKNDDSADDIKDADFSCCHYISGPVNVNGVKAGDVLVVDILDIGAHPDCLWGYTCIQDRGNGGGFMQTHFPKAHKAIWDFEGVYATSRHVTGVKFAGIMHTGIIGCAPSHELLAEWNRRESELQSELSVNGAPHNHGDAAVYCNLPTSKGAFLGSLKEGTADFERVAKEAARTIPPREHGGNVDIKNLTKGTRVYLPVFVDGAKLSVGDLHFSQGDGEITTCGAIEMAAGWVDLKCSVIKNGIKEFNMKTPMFETSPLEPRYSKHLTFEGISVDEFGKQLFLDAHVSYRMAALNAIEYFKRFGYTPEQAYVILGTAPVEGRISGIVDVPNCCTTIAVPTDIFEFDVSPTAKADPTVKRGTLATATSQIWKN